MGASFFTSLRQNKGFTLRSFQNDGKRAYWVKCLYNEGNRAHQATCLYNGIFRKLKRFRTARVCMNTASFLVHGYHKMMTASDDSLLYMALSVRKLYTFESVRLRGYKISCFSIV